MPTLTLTEILGDPRTWEGKQGGKFDSYRVRDDKGTEYEINVKHGNPPPKLGPDDFDVTPPKEGTSFPPKIKRQFSGGGGGGRGRSPEETARIERMACHKTAAQILGPIGNGANNQPNLDSYLEQFKYVTDWLIGDLPGKASQTPSQAAQQAPADDRKGFASDKQEALFRRLLKNAGGSEQTVMVIIDYCSQALSPSLISDAIDGLNSEDSEVARTTALALAEQANQWAVRDTPFPPDTSDLPAAA